jgi:hypothetical protein
MPYHLHELAVLRGVVEGDPGRYFGSTLGLSRWLDDAEGSGLIERVTAWTGDDGWTATALGYQLYDQVLNDLPRGRQVSWASPALDELLGKA